ncbi:MAG TPA: amidase family protein [Rhodopila sp.]|nr:amidase family protein [Rhodopila sp.]
MRLMRRKEISAREVLDVHLQQIERVNPKVNAIVTLAADQARDRARQLDEEAAHGRFGGRLHGLPIAHKDLVETKGIRTTFGSPIFKDYVPDFSMLMIERIQQAGAITLGKTNTPEFGAGANTRNAVYGATGNPFDPAKSCAGSSGGSAVALATNMVPLCQGSDTGGSLRNPAAFCGIVGYRPTPGLVPTERRSHGWNVLSVVGPMARTVADTALLLSAIIGDDKTDPLATTIHGQTVRHATDFHPLQPLDLSGLRVALTPDFGFAPTDQHITSVFQEKTNLFRHIFARADDATPDCAGTDDAFEVLRALGYLANHLEKSRNTPDLVGPNVRANVEEGLRYTAQDIARAMSLQTAVYQRWQSFFQNYDVILTPAITVSPRSWRELYPAEIDGKPTRTYFHWLSMAYAVSLVGHPALSLPVGLDRNGMPFGLQIVGPRGGDALVLRVAHQLETLLANDARTARPTPDLAALRAAPPISQAEGFIGFD